MKRFMLVAAIGAMILSTSMAAQEVDFSAAPNPGIKYKVVTKSESSNERTVTMGDREPREMNSTQSSVETFIQTILKISDGKILQLERQYEDASTKSTGRGGRRRRRGGEGEGGGGPRERESPLAWKHFRVTWPADADGDDAAKNGKIEVKDEDEWGALDESLKRRVRPAMFRRGLFPLPKETKKVGDRWELPEAEAKKWAGRGGGRRGRGRGGRRGGGRRGGGEQREAPEVEVTFAVEFAEVTTYREMKCAVLKAKRTVERGEDSTSTAKMTAYYSLDHKIIVGLKEERSSSMERSMERGEMTIEMSSSGKATRTVKVEVVAPGKAAEGDDE